jgi:hypothetical protein
MQYILFFSTNYWRWRKSKIASLNLIFLCAINVIVTFFRIVLNSVVIRTLWKVSLLRKKLCYFIMVMVLSCIDLLNDVITNCPTLTIYSMIRINEGYDVLQLLDICLDISYHFPAFSSLTISNLWSWVLIDIWQ